MSLITEPIQITDTVGLYIVHCRPENHSCSPIEYSSSNILAFPLKGVFVRHTSNRERVIGDICNALFFNAGEAYRVSHPITGGDECLVVEPSPAVLRDIRSSEDERIVERKGAFFPRTYVPLDGSLIWGRKLLCYRVNRRLASRLETEENALSLFARTMRFAAIRVPDLQTGSPRTRSRHREMVEATQTTLAAQPEIDWTLDTLAKRVYSSPFHLARTFRQLTGRPLHRYLLLARMAIALDQVVDSTRDLTAIGLDLGFSSHSHFTARFLRTFGTTPSILRRRARSSQVADLSKILTANVKCCA